MTEISTKINAPLPVLSALYKMFEEAGDFSQAEKMKQLLIKMYRGEFTIAFCGHFSAGKSTMINYLLKDQILPSSPIPTSANTVKVQKGEDFALVRFKNEEPVLFPAPYDIKTIKNYAKNGDIIESITISSPRFPLPETCAFMDTPGIDSTDDAHRVSTESALHLADMVFYVMDYNHVQSEVNFLFTKELIDGGKPVYLIVNQIDKHDEKELSFSSFKSSVIEAFANWNVYPDGIFFTSVRDLENPENEIGKMQTFLFEQAKKNSGGAPANMQAAKRLISHHHTWLKEKLEAEQSESLAKLDELDEGAKGNLLNRLSVLYSEMEELHTGKDKLEKSFSDSLDTLLDNAYIMPSGTRELAEKYLESSMPDFKMGLLFSRKKTEAERELRLQSFLSDLKEKTKTQLEWHLKELASKTLRENHIHNGELEEAAQKIHIDVTEDMLASLTKSQVNITGEYVLNYTSGVAAAIKKEAKHVADQFMEKLLEVTEERTAGRIWEIEAELENHRDFEKAIQSASSISAKLAEQEDMLTGILDGKSEPGIFGSPELLVEEWLRKEKESIKVNNGGSSEIKQNVITAPPAERKRSKLQQPVHPAAGMSGKEKLESMSKKLKAAAQSIQSLKGFQSLYRELNEKASRMEAQTFTVALFGAFSAGKSSFANALMGESILPVSPNPTTAAISKIMASDHEHKHGTASVRLKTPVMLLEDVKLALAVFNHYPKTLEEAYHSSKEIVRDADQAETGKTQLSFLKAFCEGYQENREMLGQLLSVDLAGFREFAAREEKSCLVDMIELYYDCGLTKQGIVLVDTPGADSINARHTGAAFEYIKNSDAILFITYYNHPFSKADREFLIQLGRVKESFAMDKMFFLVNAADLAAEKEELEDVLEYVRGELNGFGIRFPKLMPVSSKGALKEKLGKEPFSHAFLPDSGINHFQALFNDFIENELSGLAIESAKNALNRAVVLLQEVVKASKQDHKAKKAAADALAGQWKAIDRLFLANQGVTEIEKLRKEIEELVFYSRQRVFLRFSSFFKESFNPAVIKDDGQDHKLVLKNALKGLLKDLGFDLAQEMRATALRTENYMVKLVKERQMSLEQQLEKIRPGLQLQAYEPAKQATAEFLPAFLDLDVQHFKKELALFKNTKSFFEKNEKVKMNDALMKALDAPSEAYAKEQSERIFTEFSGTLNLELEALYVECQKELKEIFTGLLAALEEKVDITQYESKIENIQSMLS
ncbi:dynamin family protein [Peribacillus sp. B-H-3]|uniref:dynamin family protein n=1 Tax=Peribacillus sp. B-H-3 TaxID=3400420 RepID=UPI003B01C4D6